MRIVGGAWRGRVLKAPPGNTTRPTADRVRQALFDMLMHAPWGVRSIIDTMNVLDLFAGTGALGLEALSRGGARAVFVEQDRAALAALRANISACGAEARCNVLGSDVLADDMTMVRKTGAAQLVFLDPPYGRNLVPQAIDRLRSVGGLAPSALIVAEIGAEEPANYAEPIAERRHGAARLLIWRA